jgi:arylsulfatase A-like enzyme
MIYTKLRIIVFFLLAAIGIQSAAAQPSSKPNIVFFLVDDLGWTDVEPFGTSFYETPNIKKLAAGSMRFTNAYAACPVCSPTRASIMSGKYPARLQTTDWFGAAQPEEVLQNPKKRSAKPLLPAAYKEHLPLAETTIAEALKNAGYKTFFTGKWHLGETAPYWPEHQGFDTNAGGYAAGHPKSYFSPYSNPRLKDGPPGEHLPDRLAQETASFIEANKANPFFAYFSFYSVHTPFQGRQDLVAKYEKKKNRLGLTDKFSSEGKSKLRTVQSHATYAAMVEAMDQAVGKVIDKLKAEGVYDNTIIIFFSDNGGLSTAEGLPTANLPLRAGKGWLYEGGIREPLLIRWPGHTKNGSTCSVPVISTDFYPAILEMAGLPLLPKQHQDGTSLVPLLEGRQMDRGPLFWHYPHYGNQGGTPGSAVRNGDWKLIRWYEDGQEELFNLKTDIGEKKNVLSANPAIAATLKKELNNWLKEQEARLPAPNPNYQKQ